LRFAGILPPSVLIPACAAAWIAALMRPTVAVSLLGMSKHTLYLGSSPGLPAHGSNTWAYEKRTIPVTTLVACAVFWVVVDIVRSLPFSWFIWPEQSPLPPTPHC